VAFGNHGTNNKATHLLVSSKAPRCHSRVTSPWSIRPAAMSASLPFEREGDVGWAAQRPAAASPSDWFCGVQF
jgi:hypothetical protein